jgi:hypothetical protein
MVGGVVERMLAGSPSGIPDRTDQPVLTVPDRLRAL